MGVFLVLLSAAAFGAMGIFGKLAYAAGVQPATLLTLRFSSATVLLWAIIALRPSLAVAPEVGSGATTKATPDPHTAAPQGDGSKPNRARTVLFALAIGAVGYALQATLYFAALERIDAPLLSLVLYIYPGLVLVGAVALGRERFTTARVAGLIVASIGTILVLLGVDSLRFDALGVGLALGAAVAYTAYILFSDAALNRMSPIVLTAWVATGATATLTVRTLLTGGVTLDFAPIGWLWIACLSVVSTIVAILTFFAGMRRVGPSTASILSTFEPVVGTGLAAVVLGEFLTPVQLLGALLVLSAAAVVQLRPKAAAVVQLKPKSQTTTAKAPEARLEVEPAGTS